MASDAIKQHKRAAIRIERTANNWLDHMEHIVKLSLAEKLVKGTDRKDLEYALKRLRPSFDALIKENIEPIRQIQPIFAGYCIEKLLDLMAASFLAGSRGTVSETAGKIPRSIAGTASGESRRLEANETWRPQALKLAKKIRAKNPRIIQLKLANEICAQWTLQIHCPASMLPKAISQWERDGELAPRKK